jgi:hypothetical protein
MDAGRIKGIFNILLLIIFICRFTCNVISKKTMTKNKAEDIKNNEEFEIIYVDNKTL